MNAQYLIDDELNRARALELASFIVEAPAGAGKTELLTQRFLRLLQTVNSPEEIIAITFTNKAAAEMRARILDSLMAAASQTPPDKPHKMVTYQLSLQALQHADSRDWQLIENPSRLRIFTIDSLCAHLARQMPLMSRFGAQPKVTDDADILYALAAEQTLTLLEDATHGEIVKTALRYVENDANQLKNLLTMMLAKRDQWIKQAQHEIDAEALQATLEDLVEQALQEAANALPPALQAILMPVARFAASNLPCEHNVALLADWETPLQAAPEGLSMWRTITDFLLTATGEPRKEAGLNVKFGFPPTPEGKAHKQTLVEILAAINDLPALHNTRALPASNHADWRMITALSKLLNLAVAELWLVFQRAGEVDFVEIAQRATQALSDNFGEPTDLALKLDYQIQHLLVDEFQDTSPSQIELLERLTSGWQHGDNHTLFCVGDPMQSIYRFRKANVSLFIRAAREGIGGIQLQRLQLYRNNRANPQVVDWINSTFATIFPDADDENQGAIRYRDFIADPNKHAADSGVEVHAIIKSTDAKSEAADDAKQREAEAVIEIIQRERVNNPDAKIAVLVSAKRHLAPLVTQLRRAHRDIKFQAVEIEALAGRQIVQDLLSLTHALYHRADRVHWLSVLRAPWCGLTLSDLHKLAVHNHHATIWSLMQDDAIVENLQEKTRLQHVRDIFSEAFATQGRMPVARWIRGVWLMLNGPACLWEQADVVDVQAFFACLDNLDKRNQFSLERMDTEIEKLFAAPDSAGENVQMMTIHKSKGLEFDTVILPGLGTSTGGNHGENPLVLWEEIVTDKNVQLLAAPYVPKGAREENKVSVYDFLQARENVRDANEDARVLYVAATRAERKLHLVGVANKNAKDEIKPAVNTPLALLWPAVSQYFEQITLPENTNQIEADISDFTPQLVRLQHPQMPAILQAEITMNSGTQAFSIKPSSATSLEADMGTLAHKYMEMIAKEGLVHWPASRMDACSRSMRFWLLQKGHDKNEVDKQVPVIIAALKQTIISVEGSWILASRASRQTELSITSYIENEAQEHRIDLTFVENSVRWIIDYKLGLEVAETNTNSAAQAHKPQLVRYANLFLHENLPIKKAVFFLSLGKLVEI